MFKQPEPSLCDNCKNAGNIPGGAVSIGQDNYHQRYCSKLNIAIHSGGKQKCISHHEQDGVFNKSADIVKRIDKSWSDTNLDREFTGINSFTRLKCRNCNNTAFEVLGTGDYETSAKCLACGMYYIVHTG